MNQSNLYNNLTHINPLITEQNFINLKKFKLNSIQNNENIVYIIKISETSDKMKLIIECKETTTNNTYKIKLTLNDFQNLFTGLKAYNSLDDINEIISDILNNKNAIITPSINLEYINLSLKIFLFNGSTQEIKLELKRVNDYDKNINNANNNRLQSEINYLKKEIINLKNIINVQSQQIKELNDWKNQYSLEIEKIQIIKNNANIFKKIDSKIITNKKKLILQKIDYIMMIKFLKKKNNL